MSLRKRQPYQECAYFWGAMHKKRMKKPGWELFMRLCGRRSGSAALRHAVADAHLCEEILRLGGIFSIFRRMLAMFTRRIWLSPLARGPTAP